MEYKNFKVVFRRYASLYFIIGVDNTEVSVLLCSKSCVCFVLKGTVSAYSRQEVAKNNMLTEVSVLLCSKSCVCFVLKGTVSAYSRQEVAKNNMLY